MFLNERRWDYKLYIVRVGGVLLGEEEILKTVKERDKVRKRLGEGWKNRTRLDRKHFILPPPPLNYFEVR